MAAEDRLAVAAPAQSITHQRAQAKLLLEPSNGDGSSPGTHNLPYILTIEASHGIIAEPDRWLADKWPAFSLEPY